MFKFKKKIKVYFIAQYRAGLDKFASVVDEMKQDNSFDVKVLAVPNDISDLTENKDFDFWKKRFGDITVNALIDKDTWFDLKKEKPDYVFIQRPYDNLVPNVYSKTVISNYTKICYIPYAFSLANLFDIMMPQSEMVYLSIIFAENDEMNEYYEGLIKSIDDKKKRKSYNFGYPSLDEAKKCIESMGSAFDNFKRNKINVLWTPRWSVDKNIIETSFFDYKDSIVKYFKNNKDYNLVFRPHPLTFNNFVEKKIMTQKEVDNYLNIFKDNLHYDQSGRYFNTFGDTDVLITDFSSIIVEFMLFKKPIIYTQKEPYKKTKYMAELEKVFYKVKNEKELYKVLDELKKGVDPLKEKREKLADELFMKYDGQVAYRIKETIKNDYKK